MRASRAARIARIGNQITFFYWELVLVGINLRGKFLVLVLIILHIFGNLTRKPLQMGIHARIAIVMRDIQHITITVWRNSDTADVAIGDGKHLFALHALRLDVEARMDVVGTDFAECGRKVNRDVKRLAVIGKRLLGHTPKSRQNKSQNQG